MRIWIKRSEQLQKQHVYTFNDIIMSHFWNVLKKMEKFHVINSLQKGAIRESIASTEEIF